MTKFNELSSIKGDNITYIAVNYVVAIYKDMEFADDIECSYTFDRFEEALKFYNEEKQKAKNEYFITLEMENTFISEDEQVLLETKRINDNEID